MKRKFREEDQGLGGEVTGSAILCTLVYAALDVVNSVLNVLLFLPAVLHGSKNGAAFSDHFVSAPNINIAKAVWKCSEMGNVWFCVSKRVKRGWGGSLWYFICLLGRMETSRTHL